MRDQLPEGYLLICNLSLPTRNSYFYEYDLIIISPFVCDVVDVKHMTPVVTVDEDRLVTGGGYEETLVFSSAQNKTRVLAEEIRQEIRHGSFAAANLRVELRIVLSDRCRSARDIHFAYKDHQTNKRILLLEEAVRYYTKAYKDAARGMDRTRLEGLLRGLRARWRQRAERVGAGPPRNRLGRFHLLRHWPSADGGREYEAIDDPPCKVKVHPKEHPFDPLLRGKELEAYLAGVSKEMQLLRKLRHP